MFTQSLPKQNLVPALHTAFGYLLLTVLIAACSAQGKEPVPEKQSKKSTAIPVDGDVIKSGILKEEMEITGSLAANQQVDVVSELTRRIVKVHVREGAYVQKGQLLFEMDKEDLQAQLERLRQQEKLAILNEERLRDLIQHEAVVQQDYDQAFTNLKVLQAQIAELKVTIGKTMIRAPFAGQVGILRIYQGAVVNVNTVLTNIQDNNLIKVDFLVPEKYANIITKGGEQKFTVASDTRQHTAHIVAREARLDQNTRTLMVRAISKNPDRTLIPGQSARLQLALHSSADALTVSSQALIPSSQGYSVYVVKDSKVKLSPIDIGQRGPSSVEVLKGLKQGDTVVTSNMLRLTPGAEVDFVNLR